MKISKYLSLIFAAATLFVGCGNEEGENNNQTGGGGKKSEPVITADNLSVVVNTPITFTVTLDGVDVTAESQIVVESHGFIKVENPYTPTVDGNYKFYAAVGEKKLLSNTIQVAVTPIPPALPEDSDITNTAFNHRILLIDHTGVRCKFCPTMMTALKEVAEETEKDYHSKYYEAMSHSFTGTDPAGSDAAYTVSGYFGVNNWPTLTYNFVHDITSSANSEHIKGQIDALWKESADASVAASVAFAATSVVVTASVKAAVENEYRINAWLLEDNIYAEQTGSATNVEDDWMDMHHNAIRQVASANPISGFDLGTIQVGESASQVMKLDIVKEKWNRENMKVMLIVSAKDSKGRFEVANVAICPCPAGDSFGVAESITYDYKSNETTEE